MSIVALKHAVASLVGSGGQLGRPGPAHGSSKPSETSPLLDPESQRPLQSQPILPSPSVQRAEAVAGLPPPSPSLSVSSAGAELDERREGPILGIFGQIDPRVMSDLIIGLSDGLTVPFALTAGLSSLGETKLVITGGMAELVSGAISMGLGGYLAARSESQYYQAQVTSERQLYFDNPDMMDQELEEIVLDMGGSLDTASMLIADLSRNPKKMIDFIIRYGRGLEEPADNRQVTSALTIGSGYFFGGFVPLVPYFFTSTVGQGLLVSVIVMLITLFLFGYFKARISMGQECPQIQCVSEGLQMVLIGSLAAGSAWLLVYLIDRE